MLYDKCYMTCYGMFYNMCYVMLYNMSNVVLYNICYVMLYLTIIPRGRVGYEMIDSQRGA